MARLCLSEAMEAQKRPADAAEVVKKTEWPSSKSWAQPALALYSALAGDAPGAIADLADLKKDDPFRYAGSLENAINAACRADKVECAMQLLDGYAAAPQCPELTQSRLTIADALCARKSFPEAAAMLTKSLEQDPFNASAVKTFERLIDITAH